MENENVESPVVEENVEASEASVAGAAENVAAEIDEAIDEAKESGDKKAVKELLQLKKEIELKVNGKIIKKSFNSEDDLIKELQIAEMNKNGQQNYKEAQKHFSKLLENLKDPAMFWDTIKALNPNADDLYTQRIQKDYEELERTSQMSEEQKEIEKLRRDNSEKEARIKEWSEREAKDKSEKEMQKALEDFTSQMEEALSKTKLPKSEKVFSRIAQIIEIAEDKGYKDYPVSAAVKIAEKEYFEEIKAILSSLDPTERAKLLGPAVIKEDNKKKLEALNSKPTRVDTKAPAKQVEKVERKKVHGIKNIDFNNYLDK